MQTQAYSDWQEILQILASLPVLPGKALPKVLVGSRALQQHFPQQQIINGKSDWDVVLSVTDAIQWINKNMPTCSNQQLSISSISIQADLQKMRYTYYELEAVPEQTKIVHFKCKYKELDVIEFEIATHYVAPAKKMKQYCSKEELYSSVLILCFANQEKNQHLVNVPGFNDLECVCASVPLLRAIKLSHAAFPIKWHKHMNDLLLIKMETSTNTDLKVLTTVRMVETEKLHHFSTSRASSYYQIANEMYRAHADVKHLVAPVKAHSFLNKIKYFSVPMRHLLPIETSTYFRTLMGFPDELKLLLIREEAMCLAREGYLDTGATSNEQEAYLLALEELCVSSLSGALSFFIVFNYKDLQKLPKSISVALDTVGTNTNIVDVTSLHQITVPKDIIVHIMAFITSISDMVAFATTSKGTYQSLCTSWNLLYKHRYGRYHETATIDNVTKESFIYTARHVVGKQNAKYSLSIMSNFEPNQWKSYAPKVQASLDTMRNKYKSWKWPTNNSAISNIMNYLYKHAKVCFYTSYKTRYADAMDGDGEQEHLMQVHVPAATSATWIRFTIHTSEDITGYVPGDSKVGYKTSFSVRIKLEHVTSKPIQIHAAETSIRHLTDDEVLNNLLVQQLNCSAIHSGLFVMIVLAWVPHLHGTMVRALQSAWKSGY